MLTQQAFVEGDLAAPKNLEDLKIGLQAYDPEDDDDDDDFDDDEDDDY
ncbi:MAG: hypothetical protein Q8Q35_02585 [Nanoarchaeota archaeon]|nr:hypothetical protein [Nanoarchaeota archaeon]